jgi:hypothetical protein
MAPLRAKVYVRRLDVDRAMRVSVSIALCVTMALIAVLQLPALLPISISITDVDSTQLSFERMQTCRPSE